MNMNFRHGLGALLALTIGLSISACGDEDMPADNNTATAKIEGTIFYRERIRLPHNVEVEIVLEDVSMADAPSVVLSTLTLNPKNGPPYAFSISYNPQQIDPQKTYALRGSIHAGDNMMFTTMDYIDPFSGNPVSVLVKMVPSYDDVSG